MAIRNIKTVGSGGEGAKQESTDAHAGHDESCRCEETSKMSPQELLKLMLSDLAFWKKAKKG